MRTIEYNNVECRLYEVMATEEYHFTDNCDFLFLHHFDEYGNAVLIKEVDGKKLLVPYKIAINSELVEEGWLIYGFQAVAGGLRLHLYSPHTGETDTAYLLASRGDDFKKYHFITVTRFCRRFIFYIRRYKQRVDIQYGITFNRCHKGVLKNTNEDADEICVEITENRAGITREFQFLNIVQCGEEKQGTKTVNIYEHTDF